MTHHRHAAPRRLATEPLPRVRSYSAAPHAGAVALKSRTTEIGDGFLTTWLRSLNLPTW